MGDTDKVLAKAPGGLKTLLLPGSLGGGDWGPGLLPYLLCLSQSTRSHRGPGQAGTLQEEWSEGLAPLKGEGAPWPRCCPVASREHTFRCGRVTDLRLSLDTRTRLSHGRVRLAFHWLDVRQAKSWGTDLTNGGYFLLGQMGEGD